MDIIDFQIDIPKGKRYTEVGIVGDIHRGNEYFDEELWKQYYEGGQGGGFRDNQNQYILCIGDLMETALKDSLGVQDQSDWIEDQFIWMRDQLRPIAADGRLIALIEGNHERRATRNWIRTTRLLANDLGVHYARGFLLVRLHLYKDGKFKDYNILAHHGYGRSRTVGGKMNSVMRMFYVVPDADAFVMGHLHDRFARNIKVFLPDGTQKIKFFGMTGAYLRYGGYAEDAMYAPPSAGSLKLKLHFDMDRISGR